MELSISQLTPLVILEEEKGYNNEVFIPGKYIHRNTVDSRNRLDKGPLDIVLKQVLSYYDILTNLYSSWGYEVPCPSRLCSSVA